MYALRLLFAVCGICPAEAVAEPVGAFATVRTRNLFRESLGKSDADTEARISAAWQQLFHGDENSQRLYYPVAGGMACVPDVANNDVRSEGLSYGLMICVQLDHQAEFNQI